MKSLLKILPALIFLAATVFAQDASNFKDPFEWIFDSSAREAAPGQDIPLEISFLIPTGHYLYRDKMEWKQLSGDKILLKNVSFPPGTLKTDPITGEQREVYEEGVVLKAALELASDLTTPVQDVSLELSYQGCSEKLCFRAMRQRLTFPVKLSGTLAKPQKKSGGCGL
jgi:hypothetical protein